MDDRSLPDHPSAQRVDAVLREHGLVGRVRELPDSTRTAQDAATALGCEVRQIVKSIVFRAAGTSSPILVLASGDHRVDERWMARFVGEPLERADPEFARSATGFAIGGVPPLGHSRPLPTFIDHRLLDQREVWAAAGTPHAVCRLTSLELLRATAGRPVPVVPLIPDGAAEGRWVTFDCYGTLVDWRTGLLESLKRTLPGLDRTAAHRLFESYLVEEQRLESGPYRSYREIMIGSLIAAAAGVHLPVDRAEAAAVADSLPDWPLFPDTERALRTLDQRDVRVAILSNIDRDLLDRTLKTHRLAPTIVVTAEDVKSYKPAPAHWIRFLDESRAEPGRTWHVAGSFEYDLETANLLGFRTAYVPRYGPAMSGEEASATVSDLGDFVDRLAFPPDRTGSPRPAYAPGSPRPGPAGEGRSVG